MKPLFVRMMSIIVTGLMFVSCFSPSGDEGIGGDGVMHSVVINVVSFEQVPFSRASGAEAVTHIDIAVFDQSDSRLVKINKHDTDADFLHPSVSLPAGEYKLVVIAHCGTGVATISSPVEVAFANNKVTDTFMSYTSLSITDDTPSSSEVNINLTRVVSMIRLIMTDTEIPENLYQLRFYYTGGSSTLNPQTGYGSKNSRQTEVRLMSESVIDADGNHLFEIYTFPHIAEDEVKLTITPEDDKGNELSAERIIDGIPVKVNTITELKGKILTTGSGSSTGFNIIIDDEWNSTEHYEF